MLLKESIFIKSIFFIVLNFFSVAIFCIDDLRADLLKRIQGPIPQWITDQISTDLGNIRKITPQLVDKTFIESAGHLSRYKIFNGIVTSYDKLSTPIASKFHHFIIELSKLVRLPNVDFIVITDDYPLQKRFEIPVFGFCKLKSRENVILIPDYQVMDLVKNRNVLQQIAEGIRRFPWDNKISKAIWRGANTGGITLQNYKEAPRIKAVDMAKKFPNLLDAKINMIYDFNEPEIQALLKESACLGPTLSIIEHMQYKYQLLLDGNCASWPGAYWRLHTNCVVLKQSSEQIQWYYSLLKPWIHYIPISSDLADLIEKIKWAQNNDNKVKEIIKNANELARDNLKYIDMLYYIYIAIQKYAQLQK